MEQVESKKSYIQFNRAYDMTIHKYPYAFNLLAVIAQRAKRSEQFDNRYLQMGEALIGDYKKCGMTRQKYRTALSLLEDNQIVTVRTTNRGTIARIVSTSIFDTNPEEVTIQATGKQPTSNQQITTKKNDKKLAAIAAIVEKKPHKAKVEDGKLHVLRGSTWEEVKNPVAYLEGMKKSPDYSSPQQASQAASSVEDEEGHWNLPDGSWEIVTREAGVIKKQHLTPEEYDAYLQQSYESNP